MSRRHLASALLLLCAVAAPPSGAEAAGEIRGELVVGDRAVTQRTDRLNTAAKPSAPMFHRARRFDVRWKRTRAPAERRLRTPVLNLNAAQTVDVNFLGAQFVDDSTDVPPDSMGAVGPTQFLLAINGRVRTFTKTGTADGVIDTTLTAFFAPVNGTTRVVDPRVRYDRFTSRWFLTAISAPPTGTNRILIARSSGPTITASTTWTYFAILAAAGEFLDFDTLGIDEDALYIGAMVFDAVTDEPLDTSAFVVRKSSVLGSGPIVFSRFPSLIDLDAELGLMAPLGVDNFDTGTNAGYFIGVDVFWSGQLDLVRVNNPGGTPSLSPVIVVPTAETTLPMPVPQPPPGPSLDGLDYPRLTNAVIRSGRLWTAHHYEMDAAGAAAGGVGGRNGVRWYELTNLSGTPSVRQSGTIFDSSETSPMSYWMPSVMVSGQGHAAFGFSRAGENALGGFASAMTTGRLTDFALSTVAEPEVYGSSAFIYDPPDPANPLRWGDYSYTSLDPTDDMTMWTVQEYTSEPDKWGVRVAKLLAPAPVVTSVEPVVSGAANTGIVVKGNRFFEPGGGFSRHLTASASGGVQIHSVVSVTPSEIVLNASTVSVTPGDKTITITNPDGQSVEATLAVTGTAPPCVSCSNFNADNDQDILWHNKSNGQISAWLLDGTQFVSSTSFGGKGASLAWKPVATADFNADGKSDIVWHNSSTGAASIWLMSGDRFIESRSISGHAPASPVWSLAATGDFNGDGKPDILWHNRNTGAISTWLLNGTQFVAARSFAGKSSASLAWTPMSAPDLNSDARSDILWHNRNTGQISAWILNGTQFVRATAFSGNSSASLAWTPVAAIELNGDAKPDILWHNRNTGQISAWILNGTQFAGATSFGGKSSASLAWTPVG